MASTLAATCLAMAFCGHAAASEALYGIGADANGIGRLLAPVSPAGPGIALGDGSSAYSGLAWDAANGQVATIRNDSAGRSTLVEFALATHDTLTSETALGSGFTGGLAARGSDGLLYAIGSDSFGTSTFYQVGAGGATSLGTIGGGFYGGLTWDAQDGAFYALGSDSLSEPRSLFRIDLSGGNASATELFTLGDGGTGFLGGLAWDASASRFLAVGTDTRFDSSLYAFTLGGDSTLTRLADVGPGFVNAALAELPSAPASAVPEPAGPILLVLGGLCLLARRRVLRPLAGALR